jgi:hypothetical protein
VAPFRPTIVRNKAHPFPAHGLQNDQSMKFSNLHKHILASIGVGLLSMVLFVLLMGSVVMMGQSAG